MHSDLIASFSGIEGVNEHKLESALYMPQAMFGGQYLHETIFKQAAAYAYHLCLDHPFVDGNKRTAFAAMALFLRLNGITLIASDDDAYDVMIAVTEHRMSKDQLAHWLETVTTTRE